jgi:hypothetical protein
MDPDTLAVARKVAYAIDPTLDYPRHFSGHVKVLLKDGRVIEENRPHARGSVDEPIAPEEIESKFRHNAGLVLPASKAEGIAAFLRQLDHQPDIGLLAPLMAGDS